MTQVGHILTGAAVGVLCKPRGSTARHTAIQIVIFSLLANVPDLPFPNWGHDRYDISHSLFVNLALICLISLVLIFLPGIRKRIGGNTVIAGAYLAWLSHLFLDTLYGNSYGLAMFWPFSEARVSIPIPWLLRMPRPVLPLRPEVVQVWLLELVTFTPLLLIVTWIRKVPPIQGASGRN